MSRKKASLYHISVVPSILGRIAAKQDEDAMLRLMKEHIRDREGNDQTELGAQIDSNGVLRINGRICVPNVDGLRQEILKENHQSRLSIHPGVNKMFQDMKKHYWWKGMKRDISIFVSRCATCQQVKADHQKIAGLLQPLEIPTGKWNQISMDFIDGLPRTRKGNESIWVIVDRLTKSAHFIPVKSSRTASSLAEIYMREIVRLHGVPSSIVCDRDPIFTSKFWEAFQKSLGTRLNLSTAYHPQTDGQTERVNQILEDLLRACVLDYGGSWEDHLHLVEFTYNNSYQV